MKYNEAIKIIDEGWVRKCKGFRVCFQKQSNDEIITDYVPDSDEKPLESDVVAWRLAWKLAQAQKGDGTEPDGEKCFNIFVVDDLNNPIIHYGTGESEVFIQKNIKSKGGEEE